MAFWMGVGCLGVWPRLGKSSHERRPSMDVFPLTTLTVVSLPFVEKTRGFLPSEGTWVSQNK